MLPPLKPKDLAKVHGAQQDQDQGYGSSCRPHHFPSYHTMAPSSFPLTRQSRDSLRAVHLPLCLFSFPPSRQGLLLQVIQVTAQLLSLQRCFPEHSVQNSILFLFT